MTKNPESFINQSAEELPGGAFIIQDSQPGDVFIPEEFNEEQLMIHNMCVDFLHNELMPNLDKLENAEFVVAVDLLK